MKRLIIAAILLGIAAFLFYYKAVNVLPRRDPAPVLQPIPDPVEQWEPIAEGYTLTQHFEACGLEPDLGKIEGGWRIYASSYGNYKVRYSVDEWELIAESTKPETWSTLQQDGKVIRIFPLEVTRNPADGIIWRSRSLSQIMPPTRTPWWCYLNTRTGEWEYVYSVDSRPITNADLAKELSSENNVSDANDTNDSGQCPSGRCVDSVRNPGSRDNGATDRRQYIRRGL